jgi:hypothetical protein
MPADVPAPSDPAAVSRITEALAAPFAVSEVRFKPAIVSGNRALALAYVDARAIQDRLDDVLGVAGWQDAYRVLPDGSVVCRLRCLIGGHWITKTDVGGQSEQPDGGDRTKAAFSDALKRAAVKFGVGRYLYRLPAQWVDYDPQRKQFKTSPALPAWARPASENKSPPAKPAPLDAEGVRRLQQLAERKGVGLDKYLPQGLCESFLPTGAAPEICRQLPATAGNAGGVGLTLGGFARAWSAPGRRRGKVIPRHPQPAGPHREPACIPGLLVSRAARARLPMCKPAG